MTRHIFSGSRANRDRRDAAFARSVIAIAEKRRQDGPPHVEKCETCGGEHSPFSYSSTGKYAFCSMHCHSEYLRSMESGG